MGSFHSSHCLCPGLWWAFWKAASSDSLASWRNETLQYVPDCLCPCRELQSESGEQSGGMRGAGGARFMVCGFAVSTGRWRGSGETEQCVALRSRTLAECCLSD